MKPDDVLKKAYGNVPNEPLVSFDFNITVHRPVKYYWLKIVRFFTR